MGVVSALRAHRRLLLVAILAAVAALVVTLIEPGVTSSAATARPATATVGKRAVVVLKTLKVRSAASMRGYTRAKFGAAWTDNNLAPLGHNHCDTRDDILRRDLTSTVFAAGSRCTIATGVLNDPYLGLVIHFTRGIRTSNAVQIDHVVSLGNAWQSGARSWATATRTELANDPLNLLAVNQYSNESKGDDDAASWLPRKSFRCQYVATQIAVKARFHLSVTSREHRAMVKVLRTCPAQRVPTEAARDRLPKVASAPKSASSTPRTTVPAPTPSTTVTVTATPTLTTTAPSTTVITTAAPPPGTQYGVHPGAFCAPAGAYGYTSAGTLMVCGPASDGRNRWHSA